MQYLNWVVALAVLAVLVGGGVWAFRNHRENGGALGGGLFGPKAEKRLGYVEQMAIDGRRRLVLVRRDDVEHLILTGGPVDVVIETGIGAGPARAASDETNAVDVVYTRPARSLGQTERN